MNRGNEITFSRQHVNTQLVSSGDDIRHHDVANAVEVPEDGYVALAAALWGKSLQPPAWHEHAACAAVGPEVFDASSVTRARRARAVCAGCPVRRECAQDQWRWEHSRTEGAGRTGMATVRAGMSALERTQWHHDVADTTTAASA